MTGEDLAVWRPPRIRWRLAWQLQVVAGAVMLACNEPASHPVEPARASLLTDSGGLAMRTVIDSQANYYSADVSVTSSTPSIPHYVPHTVAPSMTYHITRQRAGGTSPWQSILLFTGQTAGRIETDDPATYRRIYNAAGTLYAPTPVAVPRLPSGLPPAHDPMPAFPSRPPGGTPFGGISGGSTLPLPSSPGSYIVTRESGQEALSALSRLAGAALATNGDTTTYAIAGNGYDVQVSVSRTSGAETGMVLRVGGRTVVQASHTYVELRPGVLARSGSTIRVASQTADGPEARIEYRLQNIVFEHREVHP